MSWKTFLAAANCALVLLACDTESEDSLGAGEASAAADAAVAPGAEGATSEAGEKASTPTGQQTSGQEAAGQENGELPSVPSENNMVAGGAAGGAAAEAAELCSALRELAEQCNVSIPDDKICDENDACENRCLVDVGCAELQALASRNEVDAEIAACFEACDE